MNITYFFHICTCIIFLFKVTFWGVSQPPSGNFKIFFFKNRSVDFFYFKSQSYLYSLLHKVIFLDFSTYFVRKKSISNLVLAKCTGRTTQETLLKPTDPGGWDESRKLLCKIFSYHNLITPKYSSVYNKIQKKFHLFRFEHWIHTYFLLIWVWAPKSRMLFPEKLTWLESTSPCAEPIHQARYVIYQIKS